MRSQRSDNFYEDIGDGLCKFFFPETKTVQNLFFLCIFATFKLNMEQNEVVMRGRK